MNTAPSYGYIATTFACNENIQSVELQLVISSAVRQAAANCPETPPPRVAKLLSYGLQQTRQSLLRDYGSLIPFDGWQSTIVRQARDFSLGQSQTPRASSRTYSERILFQLSFSTCGPTRADTQSASRRLIPLSVVRVMATRVSTSQYRRPRRVWEGSHGRHWLANALHGHTNGLNYLTPFGALPEPVLSPSPAAVSTMLINGKHLRVIPIPHSFLPSSRQIYSGVAKPRYDPRQYKTDNCWYGLTSRYSRNFSSLLLLSWGEARNLRFMPKCIFFLYH